MSYIKLWSTIALADAANELEAEAIDTAVENATETMAEEGVTFPHYSDALESERFCMLAYMTYTSQMEA